MRTVRRLTLSEKIAIVRESMAPGMVAAHVARRHGIAVNLLYYWRKVYGEIAKTDLGDAAPDAVESELADLRLQVRNLERLLGQRTLEIALLKARLNKEPDDDFTH